MWYTWLAYLGLLAGLAASAVIKTPVARSAGVGLVAGILCAVVWNVVDPNAPCLQAAKGWEILRAYTLCR
jgi:hypothetical protein